MSEVRVVCPECEGTFYYPSCTTVTKLKCPDCGSLLTAASIGEALRRRRMSRPTQTVTLALAGASGDGEIRLTGEDPPMAPPMDTILQRESEQRTTGSAAPRSVIGGQLWLILTAGVMLAFQYNADGLREYLPWYAAVRNAGVAGIVCWIVLDAMRSSIWNGLASIAFPPYLLLYAIAQVESVMLRGLVFGMLIGLTGEAWLLPSQSLFLSLGPLFSSLVDQVNGWMEAAARPSI